MKYDPADNSIIGWLIKHQIKTESGKPFDLKTHPFWFDVLTDWSPKIVMYKAAQIGGTTAMSLKLMWAMKRFGLNAAYTLPTADDAKQFVGGKLNPLIRQNPILSEYVADKDSVEQKQIGQNIVYFRGTWTERAALSFSSDLNVHDEEDRSKRGIVSQYASRQQHSPFKWEWHLSNPSTPGNGVSQYWKDSDQKHWFVTCGKCSEKQFLSWPDSIDYELKAFVCKKCRQPLSEEARRRGSWHGIKTLTKPDYSGYWFNLMMAPWVSAEEVIKLHKSKSADYFYNFVLGLPYAGAGNKLNEDEFFANLEPALTKYDDPIVIGVDSGLPNWYVIGNKKGVFFHGKCDGWQEIHALMKRFPKAIAVCDQGGDLYGQRELAETFPGRVYLCWFRPDKKTMRLVEWGKGKNSGAVIADRNRCIQQIIDELRTQRLPVFGNREDWVEPWQHFANMYKEIERDEETGEEKFVWKRSGADHLALCFVYYRIGMTKYEGGDGSRSAGAPSLVEQILQPRQAPEVTYDGLLKLPTSPVNEIKDWREVD